MPAHKRTQTCTYTCMHARTHTRVCTPCMRERMHSAPPSPGSHHLPWLRFPCLGVAPADPLRQPALLGVGGTLCSTAGSSQAQHAAVHVQSSRAQTSCSALCLQARMQVDMCVSSHLCVYECVCAWCSGGGGGSHARVFVRVRVCCWEQSKGSHDY